MAAQETSSEKPVFTFVAAHYHGPWVWKFVRKELAREGYDSISPDLPIEDPDATLDDHAAIVRQAEVQKGAAEYIDVGHSWGGDVIYRQVVGSQVSRLIFLASPLRPIIKKLPLPERPTEDSGRSLHYATWVKAEEQGAKEFDYELIGRAFYNDLPENRRQWALRQLRPHPHKPASDSNPDFNATLPKLPMDYVGFKNDRAFKPSDQERTAWILGIEYHSIRSGHFAMLSQEKKLASLLINLASRQEAVQDAKIN